MSYQVLARKWRPKNFEQLMGQEHVVTVLVNALKQQRLHHAYLFTGTRGVGKTTIARIFAKSLNCEQGITATPCGQCSTCLDIDDGRFIDLLEIDAASKTKVDDTREILDNVQYAPSRGRYKVYLIDEVHMLSRSSFNALLKTLEEPPEHVKFILATTDPQKLPVTVLSRCLQFHLKALTAKQIEAQLNTILLAEKITFDDNVLTLIAKAARGSMRDALSLTDQAIAQGDGHVCFAHVQQMLGGVDHNWPFKIIALLLKQDGQGLMAFSQEIATYTPNYSRLLAELIQLLHQVALIQLVPQSFDLSPEQLSLLHKFAQVMSPEEVQLYYQILLNGRKDLPYAADEQAAFDMTLLRLLAFKPMTLGDSAQDSPAIATQQSKVTILSELSTDSLTDTQMAKSTLQESNIASNKNLLTSSPLDDSTNNKSESLAENNELADITPNISIAEPNRIEKNVADSPSQAKVEEKATIATTGVEAILAERNMLRSRRKELEKNPKKSNDATKRQLAQNEYSPEKEEKTVDAKEQPNTATIPFALTDIRHDNYDPEIIDPSKIRHANQVNKWAYMIDTMALSGRLRQIAIHATIDANSSEDHLILNLNQSTKHLITEHAYQQLADKLSQLLAKPIQVSINIVDETEADPFKIQTDINDKRYQYAKEVLAQDDIVQVLQQDFQAVIDESTIKPL